MKKIANACLLIISLFFLTCDDILEEDISNNQVIINAPQDGQVIEGTTTQFSWLSLEGADEYQLQVSRENQTIVVDTLVSSTVFNYNLNPGLYSWRIKALNFAYDTEFNFPVGFSVEYSNDLTEQILALSTPSNGIYTNDTNILLTWGALIAADYYELEVIKNLNGQETVLQENNITSTSFNLTSNVLDEDAEYTWKVKAINSTSETNYSERTIFLDTEVPNQPSLASPSDMEIVTSIVNFSWLNGVDTGNIQSTITNTIEIASDVDFNTIFDFANTQNNSYQYTFSTTGTFYWRVKAVDQAGNESDFSMVRSISVE